MERNEVLRNKKLSLTTIRPLPVIYLINTLMYYIIYDLNVYIE